MDRLAKVWINLLTEDDDKKQGSVVVMQLVDLQPDGQVAHMYASWSSGPVAYHEGQPGAFEFALSDDILTLDHWRTESVHLAASFSGVDNDTWKFKLAFHMTFSDSNDTYSWDFGSQLMNTTGSQELHWNLPYKKP